MKCENCGAEVTEGRFCNYCGSELPREGTTNIKGNNNTVNTINNYYSASEERNEYVEPELIEFIPGDYDGLMQKNKKTMLTSVCTTFGIFAIGAVAILINGDSFLIVLSLILCIVINVFVYKQLEKRKIKFEITEHRREERINRINYKRQYDAWFNSLTEAEKQTELIRRMVEENR